MAGAVLLPHVAQAQSSTAADRAPFSTSPAPGTPSQTSPSVVDAGSGEIIVTAQRRSERLQNVPVTVSAFTGSQLERNNIRNGGDVAKITPGLSFINTGTTSQVSIRGVGTRGNSAGDEASVPIYIDGAYQPALTSGFLRFNSIERVEVLKGPQSTLFGRNATGGAINIVTVAPPVDPTVRGSISYGSYNEVLGKIYAGAGMEKVQADISGLIYRTDGYLYDTASQKHRGGDHEYSLRSKIALQPADNVKLTLIASHGETTDHGSTLGQALDGNTIGRRFPNAPPVPTGFYDVSIGHENTTEITITNVAANGTIEWEPFSLTAVTSFIKNRVNIIANDQSGLAVPVFSANTDSTSKSLYNEAYLRSPGSGRFNWLVGGVYFMDDTPYRSYVISTWSPTTRSYTLTTHHNKVSARSLAFYAQGDFAVTSTIKVIAGARYTTEKKAFDIRDFQTGASTGFTGGFVTVPTPISASTSRRFHNFSPSATLQYQPNNSINLYARYAQGFKSGIYSPGGSSLRPAEPEKIKQYEAGFKVRATPWLRVEGSGYFSRYNNLQATSRDPITLAPVLQNAASAKIKGGEFQIEATPVRRLNLRAGFAYTDGHYTQFPGAQVTYPVTSAEPPANDSCRTGTGVLLGGNRNAYCDASGQSILQIPKYNVTGGIDYTVDIGAGSVNLTSNVQYQSSFYWQANDRLREPGRALVDATLAWTSENKKYRVAVWAQNLTDRRYYQGLRTSTTSDYAIPGRPRTVGVELGFNFK